MMRLITALAFVLSGYNLLSQSFLSHQAPYLAYCVKSKNIKRADLNRTHPFNKAIKTELVSFRVESYESMPMKNGKIDTTKFIETKILDKKGEDELVDILYNHNFDPKVNKDSIISLIMICYNPRNAILFKDRRNKIVSYVEICFECLQYRKPKRLKIGDFCQDKFDLLKNHFAQQGIKLGPTEQE